MFALKLPDEEVAGRSFRHGLGERVLQGEELERSEPIEIAEDEEPDYAFAAAHLLDVMPNPWRGNEIARAVFSKLAKRYDKRRILGSYIFVLDEIHRNLLIERDRLARQIFHDLLADGTMRFMVVTDELASEKIEFNRLPKSQTISELEPRANRDTTNAQFELNLFEPMAASVFNPFERSVATFLDTQTQLYFWYRNRSRHDYFVQGWKPNRIYADFIFTTPREVEEEAEIDRVFVLEMKGKHLAGVKDAEDKLTDTGYKRDVFTTCTNLCKEKKWSQLVPFMQNKTMRFEVVDEDGWKARLKKLLEEAA